MLDAERRLVLSSHSSDRAPSSNGPLSASVGEFMEEIAHQDVRGRSLVEPSPGVAQCSQDRPVIPNIEHGVRLHDRPSKHQCTMVALATPRPGAPQPAPLSDAATQTTPTTPSDRFPTQRSRRSR